MMGLETIIVIALGAVAALALAGGIAAWCWKGWLELKRAELGIGGERRSAGSNTGSRIEVADLKERVRRLEAIAAGVDL